MSYYCTVLFTYTGVIFFSTEYNSYLLFLSNIILIYNEPTLRDKVTIYFLVQTVMLSSERSSKLGLPQINQEVYFFRVMTALKLPSLKSDRFWTRKQI